ncbi:DUF861 domain-containing protein [Stappia sp. F7233]|uniref:DUF861 domain-containing protein n=1 Tax=Stappia albiluteola TaxID=2758565 RepID=A0A839AG51_9HYPH|nr:cupin domain-containing protein [Stappia albiluteola]MBA5777904.1 DUF861 domain-containing protein [Stappia albiluteola]
MATGKAGIYRIGESESEAESYRPAAEKVVSGDPLQTIWNCYTDKTGHFSAGIWQGEPGKVHVNYTEEEVCVLLEGEVRLTDGEGNGETFRKGDAFAIPAGFRGTWETVERAKKIYVILEKA